MIIGSETMHARQRRQNDQEVEVPNEQCAAKWAVRHSTKGEWTPLKAVAKYSELPFGSSRGSHQSLQGRRDWNNSKELGTMCFVMFRLNRAAMELWRLSPCVTT